MDDKVRISQVVYLLFSSVSWKFIDFVKLEKKDHSSEFNISRVLGETTRLRTTMIS